MTAHAIGGIEGGFHRAALLRGPRRHAAALLASATAVALVTFVIWLAQPYIPVLSLGILYIFAVLALALAFGLGYSVLVSVASMLAFNWFFLPPVHSFTLADSRNWLALGVYVFIAVVVSLQAARSRRRALDAEQREAEAVVLGRLARSLLDGRALAELLDRTEADVAAVLNARWARVELGPPHPPKPGSAPLELAAGERVVGTVYVDDHAAPLLEVQRRFLPALASMLTVAEEREQMADQAVDAETLRRSDMVKTAVLRAVSHDLRTPLTAITMAAGTLDREAETLPDEDRRALLATIRDQADRLTRLVANLLDLSRLEAGAAPPAAELWPADALVAQAVTALGAGAERVEVRVSPHLPPVLVDPVHAQRILVNVLENALRYSDAGQPVVVRGTATRREVVLRVVDLGGGIAPDNLERIFEPFHHGGHGSGLGLAIARGFAEANGGRVWAESQPGQGTAVAIALPIGPSQWLTRPPAGIRLRWR